MGIDLTASFESQFKKFLNEMEKEKVSEKPNLFLIIVANTLDPIIGHGCELDIKLVNDTISKIANFVSFNIIELVIKGKDYNNKNVSTTLDKLKPTANDIVIFYYTGHGFAYDEDKKVRYPQIDLQSIPATNNKTDIHKATLNLKEIFKQVKNKGARLNLVIGDCCNDEIDFTRNFGNRVKKIRRMKEPKQELNKKVCEELFCNTRTSILVASAKKGQLSIVDPGIGSIFTMKFTENLKRIIHTPLERDETLPWDTILKKTSISTYRLSKKFDKGDGTPGNQKAFFEITSKTFDY